MKTNPTPASDTLHRLLFHALLEIRSQGHEARNKLVFHLADLFHDIVLEMEKAAKGESTYEDILLLLQRQAREKGCEKWLNHEVDRLANGVSSIAPSAADDLSSDPLRLSGSGS